jgi:hypothetical protein
MGMAYFASQGDAEVVEQLLVEAEPRKQCLIEKT